MLESLGIKITFPSNILGDDAGVLTNAISNEATLKKRHVALSYHCVQENVSSGTINPYQVGSKDNHCRPSHQTIGKRILHSTYRKVTKYESWHVISLRGVLTGMQIGSLDGSLQGILAGSLDGILTRFLSSMYDDTCYRVRPIGGMLEGIPMNCVGYTESVDIRNREKDVFVYKRERIT